MVRWGCIEGVSSLTQAHWQLRHVSGDQHHHLVGPWGGVKREVTLLCKTISLCVTLRLGNGSRIVEVWSQLTMFTSTVYLSGWVQFLDFSTSVGPSLLGCGGCGTFWLGGCSADCACTQICGFQYFDVILILAIFLTSSIREVFYPVRNDLMTKCNARFLKSISDFLVISDMVKVARSSHSQRSWWGYRFMCTIIVSHYLNPLQDVIRVLVRREYLDIINLIWTATIGSQWLLYKCLTLGKPLFFRSPKNPIMNTGSEYRQKD